MSDPNMTAEKHAYQEGVASQQAKIDELNEKHSEEKRILHNVIEMNQAKIDELQARIDEALEYLNNLSWASELDVENATNILKGNKDEN